MKEKIGIEKLVMLLDIYEEEVVGMHSVGEHITEKDDAWIISKKFGFIKWLVENDKIRILHELDELPQIYGVDYNSNECKSDRLIMLLSISSSPIKDLISYLR